MVVLPYTSRNCSRIRESASALTEAVNSVSLVFTWTLFIISLSSLSMSVKTVERSIVVLFLLSVESAASSLATSAIGLATVGGSSTGNTFTVTAAASESSVPSFILKAKLPCPSPLPFKAET